MKTQLLTLGLMAATAGYANADFIFLNGVDVGPDDTTLTISSNELRTQDLIVNTGGVVTVDTNNIIGQNTTVTVDINGGTLIVNPNIFIGNAGSGNGTVTITAGLIDFNGNLGVGRDLGTGLIEISGGAVNVDGTLTFDSNGGSNLGDGTIDFTTSSTGTLTVAGADSASFQALYASGDITAAGSNAAAFGDVFQVNGSTLSLVPEPSSLALLGLGGLVIARRRRD